MRKQAAIDKIKSDGLGEGVVQYRLRDWGVSRQRYWGCPVPIIHCGDCGAVPVPDADLPVTLPDDVTFDQPAAIPWRAIPPWKYVTCPGCGKNAERETDTFDTFFESSWYFAPLLRSEKRSRWIRQSCRKFLAARGISTSVASNTRCCTCSIRGFSPAP